MRSFLSSPLENATTPSGFIDRWKLTSRQLEVVAAAVPRAELKRFVARARRPPEQNEEVSGLLVVGDVADALLRA